MTDHDAIEDLWDGLRSAVRHYDDDPQTPVIVNPVRAALVVRRARELLAVIDGVPVGGGEPQPTTSTDNGLRRHDPNDDDPVTRAGKAAAALRYAVDLPPDMRDLAYEQVKAGLLSVGGGEPQPTTSTDNDRAERARQMIDEVTAEHARTWRTPANSQHFVYGPDRAVIACVRSGAPDRPLALHVAAALNAEPVRSAGGGDQPDTPCRLCDDTGQYPPPGAGASTFPRPCPACADKENPHGR